MMSLSSLHLELGKPQEEEGKDGVGMLLPKERRRRRRRLRQISVSVLVVIIVAIIAVALLFCRQSSDKDHDASQQSRPQPSKQDQKTSEESRPQPSKQNHDKKSPPITPTATTTTTTVVGLRRRDPLSQLDPVRELGIFNYERPDACRFLRFTGYADTSEAASLLCDYWKE